MEYSLTSVKKYKKTSQFKEVMGQLMKNKAAVAGLVFLIFLIIVSASADLLFDYDTQVIEQNISQPFSGLPWPIPLAQTSTAEISWPVWFTAAVCPCR